MTQATHTGLASQAIRRGPRWAVIGLLCLAGLDLAHFASRIYRLHPSALPLNARARPSAPDVATLRAAHLFGSAPASLEEVDRAAESRPVIYALSGTLASRDPLEGSAILGEKGQATHLYHTGDRLPNGGRLSQVMVDRVFLDLGGHLQTLKLANRLSGLGILVRQGAEQADEPLSEPVQRIAAAPPVDVSTGESLFSGIVAVPYSGAADPAGGMLLHPNKRYQRQFGLRNGDVLTAVNGTTVTSADSLTQALKSSGQSLTLTLIRNGVPQTVGLTAQN